jgi:nucleoside-diphosphate-sugar epimerase
MAEKALRLYPGPPTVCVGRLFGVFGPGQKNMLPAQILRKVAAGEAVRLEPHPERGPDGGLKVSFIYNPDLGRILVQLAEKALAGEPVPSLLNIGGPEPVALRRLAEEMGRGLKRAPLFEAGAAPRRFDLAADIGLLRQTLNPRFTRLAEALAIIHGQENSLS